MSVQINYKKKVSIKNKPNLVLFIGEKFNISSLKKHVLVSDYNFISDLIKKRDEKKKILAFDISSKKKIILVSLKKILQIPKQKIWVQIFMINSRIKKLTSST